MTAPLSRGAERGGGDTLALPPRGRFLALLLLVPGGLLILAAVLLAVPGVALCWPGLRSLAGALRSTRDVGAAAAVTLSSGSGQRIGTPVTGSREQSHGASRDSRHPLAAAGAEDYTLDSPDSVPRQLKDFAARGYVRVNRLAAGTLPPQPTGAGAATRATLAGHEAVPARYEVH